MLVPGLVNLFPRQKALSEILPDRYFDVQMKTQTHIGRETGDTDSLFGGRWRLVLLSCLMLFLELGLIRWLGANVVYLSFFSNIVLLGSFLGIGIGFLGVDKVGSWSRRIPLALFVLIAFVLVFPVRIDRRTTDVLFFGGLETNGLPIWITVPLLFVLVVALMAMVGQAVARSFRLFAPLEAYRLDIAGSLLGIVGFTLVSFLRAPPVVWAAVVAGFILVGVRPLLGPDRLALAGTVLLLGIQSLSPGLSWSPYYQVTLVPTPSGASIAVNGIPHQETFNSDYLATTVYQTPYELIGSSDGPGKVLVIGAGNGNDVALALSNGAEKVDAVEIDPRLYEIGVQMHPDRPYADERVSVAIDDGRAFMERSTGSYDLILFALPDSLTLISGQASLRLESYLFTTEALIEAKRLLGSDGTFAMYNFYREDWLVQRLARTVGEVFGTRPCVVSVGSVGRLAVIAAGPETSSSCPSPAMDLRNAPAPATDDYPFLYVREPSLPGFYAVTLGLIAIASLLAVRASVGRFGTLRPYLDLFAMGAAFLLLETKSIVQFALWFGTTWLVNSLVFAGVLISVLGAIEVVRRFKLPSPRVLYVALIVALGIAWAVPVQSLLELPLGIRWIAATVLTFTPIFLANLIFAQRFSNTATATAAFGANLLGAMVGGILEYGSLMIGYRALIIVVAFLYLGALLLTPRVQST